MLIDQTPDTETRRLGRLGSQSERGPMTTPRRVDTPTEVAHDTPATPWPRIRSSDPGRRPGFVVLLPDPGSGTELAARRGGDVLPAARRPCSRARLRHRTRSWIRRAHPDGLEPARGCRCLGPAWSPATGARACIPGPRARLHKLAPAKSPCGVVTRTSYATLGMSTRQTLDKLACQQIDTPT